MPPVRFVLGRFAVEDDAVEVENHRRQNRHAFMIRRLGTAATLRSSTILLANIGW